MSIPTPRLSMLFLGSILSVGLVACTEKDEDEDADEDGDTDTDGTDTDGTDTTGSDDTDTDVTGTDGEDTGILIVGYAGEATVSGGSYTGTEDSYYIGLAPGGNINCVVTSNLAGSDLSVGDCAACEWAFTVSSSGSAFTADTGCDQVGITDATAFDGGSYNYGFQTDYYVSGYGYYNVLAYYFSGYGWYPVALAYGDAGSMTYDWPSGYYYYYL